MKTVIHVNQHIIRANRKHGKDDPPLTVKTYKDRRNAHRVKIHGPSEIVYTSDKPLSCGAHAWVETRSKVEVYENGN